MPCLIGRKIVNPRYKKIHPDRHFALFGHKPDYWVSVDCGVCVNCVNKYKSTWNFRLQQHFRYMPIDELKNTYYVTLTMSPQFYVESRSSLSILVRRFIERVRKHEKVSLRHFLITERGDDEHGEHRIHFHGFLMNCTFPEKIWQYWAYGFVKVKPLVSNGVINGDFIGYCTGYITANVDDVIIDKHDKPFVFASKKIGLNYALDPQNLSFHHQNGQLFPLTYSFNGKLRSLPRYLRQKVFNDKELKLLTKQYFDNLSDDVIPDPPYYIGKQVYNDYTAYLDAIKSIKSKYLKIYGKKPYGEISQDAFAQSSQDELC